jgi:hypothetical protein
MLPRPLHPLAHHVDYRSALIGAGKNTVRVGLTVVELHSGHRWGEVICEICESKREVWSTPRNPSVHAKQLQRFIAHHTHP